MKDSNLNRITRCTGGFLGGLYELGQGNIPGAIAATVGPELVARPTPQMALARTLYALGRGKRVP